MQKRGEDTGTRATKGVAQRDGATQRVDLGALKTEDLCVGKNDTGKGLVELPDGNLVLGDASALKGNGDSLGGGNREVNGVHGSIGVAANLGEDAGILAVLLGNGLAAEDKSRGAVVEGRRVGGSDGSSAVADKCRLERGDLFKLDVHETLVGVDDNLALARLDGNGGDFIGKGLVSPRLLGIAVRLNGVLVLLLSGDVVLLDGVFAAVAHVELVVDVGETILDQAVLKLGVAKGGKAAGAVDVVRDARHVLHATSNLCLGQTKLDVLGGKGNSLEAGRADLVDGDGFNGLGQAGEYRRLAGRGLANRGSDDIAHIYIGNLLYGDLGLFERSLDRSGAELGRRNVEE